MSASLSAVVQTGLDRIFQEPYSYELKGKNIALATNMSAINAQGLTCFDLFASNQTKFDYSLKAAFAPEHGLDAKLNAFEHFEDSQQKEIPIFSLHGKNRRPTNDMLKGVDLIIFDLQNVGVRCYTFETTLTYLMEKASELNIPLMVLDRPNPRGGTVVEGQDLLEKYTCFFSYNHVPFCHGFTIGELAQYVNEQQMVECQLKVIPMLGWKRTMPYSETGLSWVAPSPNIPDSDTAIAYPATILIGETLEIVSVDLRGQKPFKRLGAPWIDGGELANLLNQRNLPGVIFYRENFTPVWGKYESQLCEGVALKISSLENFQPLMTQFTIFEVLQSAYPKNFEAELQKAFRKNRGKACNYLLGDDALLRSIGSKERLVEKMKMHEELYIQDFLKKRKKYLLY